MSQTKLFLTANEICYCNLRTVSVARSATYTLLLYWYRTDFFYLSNTNNKTYKIIKISKNTVFRIPYRYRNGFQKRYRIWDIFAGGWVRHWYRTVLRYALVLFSAVWNFSGIYLLPLHAYYLAEMAWRLKIEVVISTYICTYIEGLKDWRIAFRLDNRIINMHVRSHFLKLKICYRDFLKQ